MDFKQLLLCAKTGDNEAFEILFSMYRPLLLRESVVCGKLDEDLFQELCLIFLRCIDGFRL